MRIPFSSAVLKEGSGSSAVYRLHLGDDRYFFVQTHSKLVSSSDIQGDTCCVQSTHNIVL